MTGSDINAPIETLAAQIPDGASLVAPCDTNGMPMALTRALIRRGARDLTLIGGPTAGLMADLLIGAGAVAAIETAAVSLGEFGAAPRFRAAAESGRLTIRESTCPAIHAALQASEKGVPFMPLRGLIGSDILDHRPDMRVVDNPVAPAGAGADPIVLLPALRPDFALIHAARADRHGNVWIGMRREVATMAHAARATLVTVEEVCDGDLMADPVTAPGTLPGLYVERVALAPRGAWPVGFADHYPPDGNHMRAYARQARDDAGFDAYLRDHVTDAIATAAE
jgi:glutaconate CoA-transferase subunit A